MRNKCETTSEDATESFFVFFFCFFFNNLNYFYHTVELVNNLSWPNVVFIYPCT